VEEGVGEVARLHGHGANGKRGKGVVLGRKWKWTVDFWLERAWK